MRSFSRRSACAGETLSPEASGRIAAQRQEGAQARRERRVGKRRKTMGSKEGTEQDVEESTKSGLGKAVGTEDIENDGFEGLSL